MLRQLEDQMAVVFAKTEALGPGSAEGAGFRIPIFSKERHDRDPRKAGQNFQKVSLGGVASAPPPEGPGQVDEYVGAKVGRNADSMEGPHTCLSQGCNGNPSASVNIGCEKLRCFFIGRIGVKTVISHRVYR